MLPTVWLPFIGALPPLRHDPADVRTRAEELLSRPPFLAEGEGPLDRLLRFLGDQVAGFLQRLLSALSGDPLVAWLVVAVGMAVLGAVVWRATRGSTLDRGATVVPATERARSSGSWHAEADEHEAAGRSRDALRCRYAALVTALVEHGTIDERPGRTVRELDAEVAGSVPALAERVRRAGARFEAAVYGREPVTAEDLELIRGVAADVAGPRRARSETTTTAVGS